jgi:hypothetical protein
MIIGTGPVTRCVTIGDGAVPLGRASVRGEGGTAWSGLAGGGVGRLAMMSR